MTNPSAANIPAALLLTLFGVFAIALMNAAAKALTESGLPPAQVAEARFLLHSLLLLPAAAWVLRRRRRAPRRAAVVTQIVCGATVLLASLLYFPALGDNPLADVIAVAFIFPVFVVFLAALFLGERLRPRRVAAAVVGFAGVLVVLRPGGGVYAPSMFLVLFAGLAYAGYIVALRAAAARETPLITAFGAAAAAAVLCAPLALWQWRPPDAGQWQTILLMGAYAAAGHLSIAAACRFADAALAGLFQYSELIATAIVGYFIFAHIPDAWVWGGIALIIAAKAAAVWPEMRRRR